MKRLAMTFLSWSMDIGVPNIITPVIIIRLVGRSMRSQAVSTRDMGSRSRRSFGVAASVMVVSPDPGEDGAARHRGRQRARCECFRGRAARPEATDLSRSGPALNAACG